MTEGPAVDRSGLYGRRKGKPLSARREGLIAELLPALRLDLGQPVPPGLAPLFAVAVEDFRLEIGFGGAEHLLHEAAAHPQTGFIGVEPFVNGMAKALAGIDGRGLRNIRLFEGDAAAVLAWLPAASLQRVDLLYPDPWPKKRHWKRRFVSGANLDAIARVLVSGGTFRFASDIPGYVEWTLLHLCRREDFAWAAERPEDWRQPWPGWPGTRYEAKALREGRTPAYLVFRRI